MFSMFSLRFCALIFLASSVYSDDCQLGIVETGVSDEEKTAIVDKHNELRTLIAKGLVPGQPKGTNLKRMYWNEGLAAAAQNISNTCIFAHVSVKDDRWSWVGQNLYAWSGWHSSGPESVANGAVWEAGLMAWFNEHERFVFPTGGGAGHYTQMIWAHTQYVGCGYTSFISNERWKDKFYVCNYGPGGNYVGQAPYETGDSIECENLC